MLEKSRLEEDKKLENMKDHPKKIYINAKREVERSTDYFIHRYFERSKKYLARGFEPRYIETDDVVQWITNKFSYANVTTRDI